MSIERELALLADMGVSMEAAGVGSGLDDRVKKAAATADAWRLATEKEAADRFFKDRACVGVRADIRAVILTLLDAYDRADPLNNSPQARQAAMALLAQLSTPGYRVDPLY